MYENINFKVFLNTEILVLLNLNRYIFDNKLTVTNSLVALLTDKCLIIPN